MQNTAAPFDQRASVRPIAFVLQNGQVFSSPVVLKIRPEDLTRPETARATVTQTLGRGQQGWVDNFGEGLPSCRISGHTGWRSSTASGEDGAEAFETLNWLVTKTYHRAKQDAIDNGEDPAQVKLLFIDMLDNFCWNVNPAIFEMKRNKSRPLLFQYNMFMQAISTDVENQFIVMPFRGTIAGGLSAMGGLLGKLGGMLGTIKSWIAQAVAYKDAVLGPIAAAIHRFTELAHGVFTAVQDVVVDLKNGISSTANSLIGMASDIASVGVGIYRTISSIASIPGHLKAALGSVASAFNEMVCIFANSLRPRDTYNNYDGLFGASNCSSTTGGRAPSLYSNSNAFSLMQEERSPISMSTDAMSSVSVMSRMDPVLAPMPLPEVQRHVDLINDGVKIENPAPGITVYTLSDG